MAYVPTTLYRGTQTKVAATAADYWQLIWDGWTVGEPVAPEPEPTHLHTSSEITDFVEAAQDAVAAMLGAGTNVVLTYDDATNTLSVDATGSGSGLDAEAVRDAIGVALVGIGNVSVAVNDGADTITISTTATANATDAYLLARANHTGEQAISTVTGLQAALDDKIPADDVATIDVITQAAYDALGAGRPADRVYLVQD